MREATAPYPDVLVSYSDRMNEHDPGDSGFVPRVSATYGHLIDKWVTKGAQPNDPRKDSYPYLSQAVLLNDCDYRRQYAVGSRPIMHEYALSDGQGGVRRFGVRYREGGYDRRGHGWVWRTNRDRPRHERRNSNAGADASTDASPDGDADAGADDGGPPGAVCQGTCTPTGGGGFDPFPSYVWFEKEGAQQPVPLDGLPWTSWLDVEFDELTCPTCSCVAPTNPIGGCMLPAVWSVESTGCQDPSSPTVTPFDPPAHWAGSCTSANPIEAGILCDGEPCVKSLVLQPPTIAPCVAEPAMLPEGQTPSQPRATKV